MFIYQVVYAEQTTSLTFAVDQLEDAPDLSVRDPLNGVDPGLAVAGSEGKISLFHSFYPQTVSGGISAPGHPVLFHKNTTVSPGATGTKARGRPGQEGDREIKRIRKKSE